MTSSKLALCAATAATIAALGTATVATAADDWPTKPVALVVPFPPGGGNDVVARIVSPGLAKALGQPVVVENRAGAGGTLGAGYVAKAAPDGYTLLLCSTGNIAVAPSLYTKLSYVVSDFAPVIQIVDTPTVWVASPQVPASSLKEFLAAAKTKPGQYNFASSGVGTTPHLAGEALKARYGLDMQHIPYKGTTPAYADLATDRVQVMMDSVISALPFIQSGRVKGLSIGTDERIAQLPDVPTLKEQGLTDLSFTGWVGVCAPKGTPAAVIDKVNAGVKAALAEPEVQATFARTIALPVGGSAAQFGETIARDSAVWKRIVESSGAKVD